AELARTWLATSSPRAARAMQEREQEAARSRRDRRPGGDWRGRQADRAAEEELDGVRWATEPEPANPDDADIEAARQALAREMALARARARAREERQGETL
ncbi:hypothetical protein AB0J43_22505, partial [Nonomuraea fuscirosea]